LPAAQPPTVVRPSQAGAVHRDAFTIDDAFIIATDAQLATRRSVGDRGDRTDCVDEPGEHGRKIALPGDLTDALASLLPGSALEPLVHGFVLGADRVQLSGRGCDVTGFGVALHHR
jgi:hypothetical protein